MRAKSDSIVLGKYVARENERSVAKEEGETSSRRVGEFAGLVDGLKLAFGSREQSQFSLSLRKAM